MKVSLKTPTLDLEIDDVKKLEDVLEFVAALKTLEAGAEKPKAQQGPPKTQKNKKA